MAVFKILSCEALGPNVSGFVVSFTSGTLTSGDTFVCYMTHHPVTFTVTKATSFGGSVRLICAGPVGHKDEFSGAVVNTAGKGVPGGFHFEHSSTPA